MKTAVAGKTRMAVQARSEGDGMENNHFSEILDTESGTCDYKKPPLISTFVPSPGKRKEPKFVPYEPYKAAVSPIIPYINKKEKNYIKLVKDKENKPLISETPDKYLPTSLQLSEGKDLINSQTKSCCTEELNDKSHILQWEEEKLNYENKIEYLIKEKKELESQFKIQTQVNAELKKLLVASLGEDLQVKVQYLSEDKAKLGEDVLLYSEKLFQNNEELEKLSVQCDIWKSKFQASSLIVDELAGWKVVLSRKYNEALGALECLLDEHNEIYKQLKVTYRTLRHVQDAFDPAASQHPRCALQPCNLFKLMTATRSLSDDIHNRLLGTLPFPQNEAINDTQQWTLGEQLARKVTGSKDSLPVLMRIEADSREGRGLGAKACQLLPHTCDRETTVNCCKHCSGEIKFM